METTITKTRWIGVGRANNTDAFAAGSAAGEEARTGHANPKLFVVFCSHAYDLPALIRGVRSTAPEVPLIGCSTAGEIATDGPGDASVVVAAIGGEGFLIETSAAVSSNGDLRSASAAVAGCLRVTESHPHQVLLLLSDGLAGDQQEVVRGAYAVVGASVPLVGGCAGDDLKMDTTYQFHGDDVLKNAVVGAASSSDSPIGIGVQHGWTKVGDPMLVTSSSSNRVYTLDDRPALDAYLTRLNAPVEAWSDPAAFTTFAITHPLGLSRRSGEEVRFIAEADFEQRALACIAEVPQGGLAWVMQGDEASVLDATDAACRDALLSLGDRSPIGFLAFDCIARRGVLGDEGIKREIDRIGSFAAHAPVAGFYTYGEFARTKGVNGFHNQTLVVLALS